MDNIEIYRIPQTSQERRHLRNLIDDFVGTQSLAPPLDREMLAELSDRLIYEYGLDPAIKGWLMVEVHNCVWRETVASIPYDKRILLLPKCLSHSTQCQADVDEFGLLCHRCNHCTIPSLQDRADDLGMMSIVAEGFTSVIGLIENRVVDAVIGVSCLDSLEKAFPLLIDNAVPGLAIPLNKSGCIDTDVDCDYVDRMIRMQSDKETFFLDYEHLKSTLNTWFSAENLNSLLEKPDDLTSRVAREWLGGEGKRWRPYLLAATYMALSGDKEIPKEVELAAIAVECFHKASLVHDDIEDNDATRYGKDTIHATYGEAIAINVGDMLLGYGYQLLARCGNMELVTVAAKAHADLCRGQGMELEWNAAPGQLTTEFVLQVFRLKTVPAFDVSLAMGVICAGGDQSLIDCLHRYSDALGIAYQLFDDLEDGGMGSAIISPRELAEEYHRKALQALHEIRHTELKRLLFRVTKRILK
ncbi:polyprenyl synthetase family protein [Parabacteroides sp. OttesenSCG-928-G06]|nr:polyprenyl synthetase family protein [Parabacteroides sp. OttesenSCG-928-G06]